MRAFLIAFLCVAAFAAAPSAAQDTPQSLRDEAFEAAQWAMVSDAADALAQLSARFAQGDGDVAPLADKREDLLARRASLERRMEETYAQSGAEADQRRAALRTEHETVLKDLTSVEGEIERRFPDYAELTSPKALPVKEVQALLAPNEGMILILSNPEAAYVWGVSKTKVTWARAED
ncbi:MAG TPA: hypothetical protein VD929_07070, partial [Caulobacteraceae bacterium]|nr:hypothetical protein [Caulobacteraceae bacterium]